MRAEKVGRDTLLAQIVQMVAQAQRSRAPIQRLADQVSGWFVPAGDRGRARSPSPPGRLFGPEPRLAYGLVAAVSVLIIACPCALGLATPMSIMVGVGRGAQAGVLIKNAEALERMEKVDTLVVDKTGTLTEGKPKVTAVVPARGFDESGGPARSPRASSARSEHPLAAAIVAAAAARKIELAPRARLRLADRQGRDRHGRAPARRASAMPPSWPSSASPPPRSTSEAERLRQDGATAIFVARRRQARRRHRHRRSGEGRRRPPRSTRCAGDGLRIVMLTGDNRTTALAVARRLGIAEVEAEVLPERKSAVVERLRREGRVVAMAGDGVNDAPALAAADVGIAMGTGTDVAIESAGVTLLKGDLGGIVRARKLSAAVMRNIRQNLFFAFVYNAAGVPIAAGVLYPVFGILLSPVIAAAAMALSSVSVIGNALRLRAGASCKASADDGVALPGRWREAVLVARGGFDHAQVLLDRDVIGLVGHQTDDNSARALLGLLNQHLEFLLARHLGLGGDGQLVAVMILIFAGVAEQQGAFDR